MENKKFAELGLSREVLRAVDAMGYEEATAIQSQCIPPLMEGKDVIGQSQTGTGKTAAFAIPSIERTHTLEKAVQTLVLCPTRELAMQACEEFGKFARFKRGIHAVAIYGGAPMDRQIRALKSGVQVVIGTPGRVMDHMRRGTLKLQHLKTIVLDEADEMLNMGFIDDIETILKGIPEDHQTVLFSATMPPEILSIAKRYQKDPLLVRIAHKQLTVEGIEQVYYEAPRGRKTEVLCRLIDVMNPKRSIVFCNTKRQVDELAQRLILCGYQADCLHGDMKQTARTRVMNLFKRGKVDLLVATDVAARGIDVDNVDIVFNFDIPQDLEYYVHRIGRTGRAGRCGLAVTLVSGGREVAELRGIQNYTKSRIQHRAVPSTAEVLSGKQSSFVEEVRQALIERDNTPYQELIDQLMEETGDTAAEIAAALAGMLLGPQTSPAPDFLEEEPKKSQKRRKMTRISINAGKNKRFTPGDIVGALAAQSGIRGTDIGSIEILEKQTFAKITDRHVSKVLDAMNAPEGKIKGVKVTVELCE